MTIPVGFRTLLFVVLLTVVAPIGNASAQARDMDPFIGTWILNVEKSIYEGTPAPKSEIRTFDYHGDGILLCTYQAESARGNRTFGHWLTTMDGKEIPEYTRSAGAAPIGNKLSHRKVDAHTFESTIMESGRILQTGTWVVSPDGKTLTQTLKGTNAQGQPTRRVRVYEKQ